MLETRLFLLLLKPSLLSFSAAVLTALIVIGLESWAYVASSPWLFDIFYGDHGMITFIEQSPRAFAALQSLFANGLIAKSEYSGAVIVAAIIAGAIMFFVIHSLKRFFKDMHELATGTYAERRIQFRRVVTRVVVGVSWIFYIYLFIRFILPLCLMLSRVAADSTTIWSVGAIWVCSVLLLIVALHLHVIFARLAMLRPRLFGGNMEINSALITKVLR